MSNSTENAEKDVICICRKCTCKANKPVDTQKTSKPDEKPDSSEKKSKKTPEDQVVETVSDFLLSLKTARTITDFDSRLKQLVERRLMEFHWEVRYGDKKKCPEVGDILTLGDEDKNLTVRAEVVLVKFYPKTLIYEISTKLLHNADVYKFSVDVHRQHITLDHTLPISNVKRWIHDYEAPKKK